jgi:O-antigen/teichoic acid export membrane protein
VATASEHVAAPRDGGDERPRLLRDAVVNASGILISSAVALLVVPIMLRGLGAAAYGLWIAVSAVVAIAVSFDLGLGWTVVRQIAADSRGEPKAETVQFFQAAANAYLVLGVLSGAVLWIVGLVVAYQMPFSPELRAVAPFLFAMAGIGLVGERMTAFAVAVLHGMRRFGSAVMLVSGFAILRGVGIAMLLWNGGSVREVAVWHRAGFGRGRHVAAGQPPQRIPDGSPRSNLAIAALPC